ncbi:hypothetical protein BS47DRAFT_1291458 [Hydnum rufescens UP504]|uniref:Integrase zinc-binding domain-containing protein n=1 Tax=Hydnum rufescens UP504 TaxID=1448309 RepID=A0A9P6E0H7_9AGAM|nr:hypothetical protein BS47DRAFT_1291458 [Hydnum rufescens UP504]
MQPVRANGSREPSPDQPAAPAPVGPPGVNPNYISREDFAIIMDRYLNSLSRKNREKALLTQATYNDILKLLLAGQAHEEQAQGSTADPDANRSIPGDVDIDPSLDTPQFRFWVRKMFTVQKIGDVDVVAHNDKPVAVQEQLYDILIHCHAQTSHGGRDKTSAMVNEHYSWIPKVFIDTFVKACPGCPRKISAARRAGGGGGGEGDGPGAAGEDGAHSGSSPLADDHTTSPAEASATDQGVRRDDEAEEDEAETEVPLNYPAPPGGNSREDDEKDESKDIRGETK